MEWLWTVLLMVAMVAAAITAITLFQRSMSKPGAHHDMATMSGALSGLDEAFNPHAAQARLEREEQSRQRAPIPSPGDLPKGVVFEMDDDGVPTKVVIRAPRRTPESRAPEGGGGPAGGPAADGGSRPGSSAGGRRDAQPVNGRHGSRPPGPVRAQG